MGVCARKKGQDRTGKKSQKGYIAPICGDTPTEAMYMKICVVGDILEFSIFPNYFERALQQYSATALPVTQPFTGASFINDYYTLTIHYCWHRGSDFISIWFRPGLLRRPHFLQGKNEVCWSYDLKPTV